MISAFVRWLGQVLRRQMRPRLAPTACVLLLLLPVGLLAEEPAVEARKFVSVIRAEDVRPHIEHLASDQFKGRSGEDALAAADYLRTHFKQLGLKPLFGESYYQNIPGPKTKANEPTIYGRNVGAWLPGSDETLKDEFVIVSAHYDHLGTRGDRIFRGADDNASGTSMLMEVARQYSQLKEPPKRSLVFLGFDLEENALWGSRWFVAHAPWPLEKVKLFTTADMIGRSLGNLPLKTVFVMGDEHGRGLSDVLDSIGAPQGLSISRFGIDMVGTRSDYGPFRDRKVPFLFFSSGEHPDYHTPDDVPERIDFAQVAAVSGLVLKITQQVANADQTPTWTDEVVPRLEEVAAINRICKLLLAAESEKPLTGLQRLIVEQAEAKTRQILANGKVTPQERAGLIRTAQLLLFSVF